MASKWASFEDRIRGLASLIYGYPCRPMKIGGVDVDGVIDLKDGRYILIEITVRRALDKVREDVVKLRTARAALVDQNIFAECFCVVDGAITQAMFDAGKALTIKVYPSENFARLFFDFASYSNARKQARFGSAVDPSDGLDDQASYIGVRYRSQESGREYDIQAIAQLIKAGRKVILVGEYGAGKSRCLKEVFLHLSDNEPSEDLCYPMAVDLREAWGLKRGTELVRRHLEDLGLGRLADHAIRALASGSIALLIDGFDEMGSQSWSNDGKQLRAIRAQALQGVKDLIQRSPGGILITGRDHYFPTTEEMFSALGLTPEDTIVIRCRNEFTTEELQAFFDSRRISLILPPWLPKRPLICQTIASLPPEQIDLMFGVDGGEVEFWDHLVNAICERDASIHPTFDANTIKAVLTQLATLTRAKAANVGPVSLAESQQAFNAVVGQMPIEEASAMLQRLPCLGRLNAESNDRQFVDEYILDGLRAIDVAEMSQSDGASRRAIASAVWINPLGELGLRVLARTAATSQRELLAVASRCLSDHNRVLGSDIVGALLLSGSAAIDFQGLAVDQGKFLYCDLSQAAVSNLRFSNSYFSRLVLPAAAPVGTTLTACVAERVLGATSVAGLPPWITGLDAEQYDSTENVARVRKLNLTPVHQVLVTIVKKTFFQKGSGRKEEALLRGLGQIVPPPTLQRILGILMREGCLTRFRGDDGNVYSPNRADAARMQRMLYTLTSSDDPVWREVGEL